MRHNNLNTPIVIRKNPARSQNRFKYHPKQFKTPTIEEIYSKNRTRERDLSEGKPSQTVIDKDDTIFNPGFHTEMFREVISMDHSWSTFGGANVAKNIA
jgi:hypothetical protein